MFCEMGSVHGRGGGGGGPVVAYEPRYPRGCSLDSKNFFYEMGYRYSDGLPISLNDYVGSHVYPSIHAYVSNADNLKDLIEQFEELSVNPAKVRIPPRSYTCHLCYQKGHFIKDCSLNTNGLPRFLQRRGHSSIPPAFPTRDRPSDHSTPAIHAVDRPPGRLDEGARPEGCKPLDIAPLASARVLQMSTN